MTSKISKNARPVKLSAAGRQNSKEKPLFGSQDYNESPAASPVKKSKKKLSVAGRQNSKEKPLFGGQGYNDPEKLDSIVFHNPVSEIFDDEAAEAELQKGVFEAVEAESEKEVFEDTRGTRTTPDSSNKSKYAGLPRKQKRPPKIKSQDFILQKSQSEGKAPFEMDGVPGHAQDLEQGSITGQRMPLKRSPSEDATGNSY
jgi:hypothetical protein